MLLVSELVCFAFNKRERERAVCARRALSSAHPVSSMLALGNVLVLQPLASRLILAVGWLSYERIMAWSERIVVAPMRP